MKIEEFKIYLSTYYLIKAGSKKAQERLALASWDYIFKDIDPNFSEGEEEYGLWVNIERVLSKTKTKIINGRKGGKSKMEANTEPKFKANDEPNFEPNTIPNLEANSKVKTKASNISYLLLNISNYEFINKNINLKNKIIEWLKYKQERNEIYKETGLKTLIAKLERLGIQYGEEKLINLIDESMSSNYKGIIFDKLENTSQKLTFTSKREENREALKAMRERYGER